MLACVLLPPDLPDAARRLFAVCPVVELQGATAFLDVAGTERLHGGPAGLFRAVTRALLPHAPLGLALASNRFTAEIAARCTARALSASSRRAVLVPPGDEALFLSRAPLELLPMSAGLRERLLPLGLSTLGDLASLPVAAVSRRFGAEGVAMHRLARGEDRSQLLATPDDTPLSVLHEPLDPLPDLAQLRPALESCLAGLCGALDARGLALVQLDLALTLDDGRVERWPLRPAEPEIRVPLLADLLVMAIERRPPQRAVTGLLLTARETARPAVHQNTLLGGVSRDAARRTEALARVAALLGAAAVLRPVLRRAHRIEDRWTHGPPQVAARAATPAPAGPVLRWQQPPRELVPLRAGHELLAFRDGRTELVIAALSAPRRLEGGWWADPWARDEYDLLTPDGGRYRICRDMAARRWLLLAELD